MRVSAERVQKINEPMGQWNNFIVYAAEGNGMHVK